MVELIKLVLVFMVIVVVLKFTRLLPLAIGLAALAVVLLFQMDWFESLKVAGLSVISPLTVTTLLAFYSITFYQRVLEKRGKLNRAQQALDNIFNNRRINASLAPMVIGMLPSAAVVTIAGAIVDKSAEDRLTLEEKAFVSSYYRHVSEAFLPTFPSVIIGAELAGVALSSFLIGVIPVIVLIIALGFVFYLRKIPRHTGNPPCKTKGREVLAFFQSLWGLFVIVVLVIALKMPVYIPVVGVAFLSIFIDRFKMRELGPMFISAFEPKLLLSTVFIMIFKDILIAAKVITILPDLFSQLPLPSFLVYMLIIFFGSIISGQQAINVVVLPMAFAATGEGASLFVLLMISGYAAMQISPTHICLPIIADYFKVTLGGVVKKTIPVIIPLLILVGFYYLFLKNVFGF